MSEETKTSEEKKTSKKTKSCPMKFSNPNRSDFGVECEKSNCEWYNTSWEKCNMILEGHIAGHAQALKESRGY